MSSASLFTIAVFCSYKLNQCAVLSILVLHLTLVFPFCIQRKSTVQGINKSKHLTQ